VKGVILHGGAGTRLRPLTYTDVKQLLPLAGKPVSEYILSNLIDLGIDEVNIVLGDVGRNEVQEYYGDGSKWGIRISYTYQGRPLGIAHAIGIVREFVKDDDFVVTLGDNYFHNGFKELSRDFEEHGKEAYIAITEVPNPGQFGVAEISGGKITGITEKPSNPRSKFAVTGVYFLRKSVFPFINSLKPSLRGELEITEVFQKMIDAGMEIGYSVITGWWKDTGTPEEFLSCNRLALDALVSKSGDEHGTYSKTYLSENVTIDSRSKILGPCYIGSGSRIVNSSIGPYSSIGRNCRLEDCSVENSVIMDNVSILLDQSLKVKDSIVGPASVIKPNEAEEKSLRVIIGRDSKIEV
jgi:glucose-1-phosphate thymidylyltransferase